MRKEIITAKIDSLIGVFNKRSNRAMIWQMLNQLKPIGSKNTQPQVIVGEMKEYDTYAARLNAVKADILDGDVQKASGGLEALKAAFDKKTAEYLTRSLSYKNGFKVVNHRTAVRYKGYSQQIDNILKAI